jgi:hypothetical protein
MIAAPEEIETVGVDIETLRRIQLFRGLILRVKHSFLWNLAPLTATRLERVGLLLRTFAGYGADRPIMGFDGTPHERTRRFLEHLSEKPLSAGARIDGVARHEFHLLSYGLQEEADPMVWPPPNQNSRLRLATGVQLEAYDGRPDDPAGARLSSIGSAAVLILYRSGRYRVVQGGADIKALSSALADDLFGSVVAEHLGSRLGGDLRLFNSLCAEGFLVAEQVWTA